MLLICKAWMSHPGPICTPQVRCPDLLPLWCSGTKINPMQKVAQYHIGKLLQLLHGPQTLLPKMRLWENFNLFKQELCYFRQLEKISFCGYHPFNTDPSRNEPNLSLKESSAQREEGKERENEGGREEGENEWINEQTGGHNIKCLVVRYRK